VSVFNAGQKADISRSANYLEGTKTERVGLIKFSMAALRREKRYRKGRGGGPLFSELVSEFTANPRARTGGSSRLTRDIVSRGSIVSLDFESLRLEASRHSLTGFSLPVAAAKGPRAAENRGKSTANGGRRRIDGSSFSLAGRPRQLVTRRSIMLGCVLTLSAVEKKRIDVYRREILILR